MYLLFKKNYLHYIKLIFNILIYNYIKLLNYYIEINFRFNYVIYMFIIHYMKILVIIAYY